MKRAAVLTDISGLGNCSGSANCAILSALGVEPCLLPTAVLSAQTGFEQHTFSVLEDAFCRSCESLIKLSPSLDAVYVGFVTNERQFAAAASLAQHFSKRGAAVVYDPIIGDGGERFSFIGQGLFERIKSLAKTADVITPNVTEFCLLCSAEPVSDIETLSKLCREYVKGSRRTVIVTGIEQESGISVIVCDSERLSVHTAKKYGGSYSGTGDIFTSFICAAAAKREDLHKAAKTAADFISRTLRKHAAEITDRNYGIPFQEELARSVEF